MMQFIITMLIGFTLTLGACLALCVLWLAFNVGTLVLEKLSWHYWTLKDNYREWKRRRRNARKN